MNKSELARRVGELAGLSGAEASGVVDAIFGSGRSHRQRSRCR